MSMRNVGAAANTTLTAVQSDDVQPNAVDLRIDKVFAISPRMFLISEDVKNHRGSTELQPDSNGFFTLQPGSYEVVMENIVNVGAGEAGWVITRSTLNRNGVFLTSGLYDTGYHGVMAGVMHVTIGPAVIKRGTRIGQYLCFEAESVKKYDGSYGIGKAHDAKYGAIAAPTKEDEAVFDAPVKRGRGRPKGSKNKVKKG
jgi:deoxycytidine triphosphate deaminase